MIANARAVPRANARVVQIEMRQAAVVRKILGIVEHVSNAADGVNQRCAAIGVYFVAQTINVDIDHISCRIDPHTPDVIQDHGTSYNTSGIAAKVLQEQKLLRGQLEQVITAPLFMSDEFKLQVGVCQPYRVTMCR